MPTDPFKKLHSGSLTVTLPVYFFQLPVPVILLELKRTKDAVMLYYL